MRRLFPWALAGLMGCAGAVTAQQEGPLAGDPLDRIQADKVVVNEAFIADVKQRLRWTPSDPFTFTRLVRNANMAGVPEALVLLPQLDAHILFGDVNRVTRYLAAVGAAKEQIIAARGGGAENREEVERSIRLGEKFLAFAEKRPKEVAERTQIFRMRLFAQETLEDARMIDSALDQLAIEKNLKEGTEATWDDLKVYLKPGTRLYATGATLLGDKFGPFKVDTITKIPKGSFEQLNAYLPIEQWEPFVPE